MSRDLSINVNVNPNGVASPTQTRITQAPESNEISNRTLNNPVVVGAAITIAQRSLRIATANIGELTGSRTLQRDAQRATALVGLGLVAKTSPVSAGILALTQAATFAVSTSIENRNLESNIRYQQTLRSATHNNSRR